ncbi:protein unc-45 a-like protein, partial [Nannochloropsis gaditana CCMP526]|uniref:protein unc-45 a-like protein n=1 Tax=Nannochloropsis gaditana (strain CCMP526) TaxID=1093141 RepID=UPI00029F5A77
MVEDGETSPHKGRLSLDTLRERGNLLYQRGCYGEAILAWTEALALLSSEKDRLSVGRSRSAKMTRCSISPEDRIISLLFSNRAQAQLQLREYESAESDAGTALC